jgi:RHS repeat-associated protein
MRSDPSGTSGQARSDDPVPSPKLELPAIALPKGGGAIRGLGEKLTVGPTGSASFGVPIPMSAARGGAGTPQLSLVYDSSAGNGVFGLGWSVSLPAIARKTEKLLPRYRDGEASDVFVMSGVEDLVPALVAPSWQPDVVERDGYRIERYRPRLEGTFARIERWTERATGTAHWRSTTGDNVTTIFGRSECTRIADPTDPTHVFKWLIEEVRDDRGNVVSYEYAADDASALDRTRPDERHRVVTANRYLKRVRYGNQTPFVAAEWHFETVFDYGDHDEAVPPLEPDRPVPRRLDPFSTYRAGFEIRTFRLCRRVLVFHVFPELGGPRLVRSLRLGYDETTAVTTLTSIVQCGHIAVGDGYSTKSMPALELEYTRPASEPALQILDDASGEHLPAGLASGYQWIDLDSEGLSGVLATHGGGWYYKRNLGGGQLGALELVTAAPRSGSRAAAQVLDLANDGRKYLAELSGAAPGYYAREGDTWSPFRPFTAMPVLDWNGKSHRLIDLDGDGLADVLVTEDHAWSWHPSRGLDGFGPREPIAVARDEERGPVVVFADPTQSIFLADMSGDGLVDIVRIRNGEVCYWPNLGFGRFGAKVAMASAPVFDHFDTFDPKRLRLADVDGTGCVDVLYLGRDAVRWWPNQAGNGWGDPRVFSTLPRVDDLSSISVFDFLGNGTACVVWSSSAPRDTCRPLAYLDLMGGQKPFLLASSRNNLGAESRVGYAASTKFFVADRAAGQPWVTKLPFPVQVVERVETRDLVTGNRFVSTYSYHHGYYDGAEQEFRGFARVDQVDTEDYPAFAGAGLLPAGTNVDEALHVPPVLTRTWYHTGAYLDGERIETRLAAEYWSGDSHPQAIVLPDTVLPAGLETSEVIEACRALKGQVLRQEVYAIDGNPNPYSVSERSYAVRREQPRAGNRNAVMLGHAREAVELHYERALDPRVTHAITLDVDALGRVRRSAAISYPRRGTPPFAEQGQLAIVTSESDFIHVTSEPEWYRVGVPLESRSYEVAPASPPPVARYRVEEIQSILASLADAPYEATVTPGTRRLLSRGYNIYFDNALAQPLAHGAIESLAVPYESYQLALTPDLVTTLWGGRVTPQMLLDEAHYVAGEGGWWIPSGRLDLDQARFYLPVRLRDPFGNVATVTYDPYSVLVVRGDSSQDPTLNNVVTTVPDYRTLSPSLITDPNGNRAAVRSDELGLVIATAVMGKETGPVEGDTLDDPTTRLEYDLATVPAVIHSFAREQHGAANTRWQESFQYSDGFGRVVQNKVQAAPDPDTLAPRWIGSGRTVFNNKGLPVKQYEPFFSATAAYETEEALVTSGVTPVLHYDPLGRVIRTDFPDGTLSRVVFDPWQQSSWDANDTVLESRWYLEHSAAAASAEDQRAAALAQVHANTPAIAHLDSLGRTFLAIADNGADGTVRATTVLDIQGRSLEARDHFDRAVMAYRYTMTGGRVSQLSMDAGERWLFSDIGGAMLRSWDSRGHARRVEYDLLRRPTHAWLATDGGPERVTDRTIYGERVTNSAQLNVRGKMYRHYDGAGVATTEACDFKGNVASASRRLAASYQAVADWSVLAVSADLAVLATLAEPQLEAQTFTTTTTRDALGRVTSAISPDASEALPVYNEASQLRQLSVRIRGGEPVQFVSRVDYDAKGQRTRIEYDSGVATTYMRDPNAFRLSQIATTRLSDGARLQDLAYTYDAAGNIVAIADGAQQTNYFDNGVVSPSALYEYDALYRLRRAEGRELIALATQGKVTWDDAPRVGQPNPNDHAAMQRYVEQYVYDPAGNILSMTHSATHNSWTRAYQYATDSNRLLATDGDAYAYDPHGNMTAMPHLPSIGWNEHDQLRIVDLGGGGTAYYVYDATGQRVRKVIETQGALVKERIYLGGVEIYRERVGGVMRLERETLHVMDDTQRIALVETLTRDEGAAIATPSPVIRYQLANHLGTAALELSASFAIVSYEEYYPYGSTSYQAGTSAAEVSLKRYRFTGKERDEETGLYYHGARYYAPWLGRWTATDPSEMSDGLNVYVYCHARPIGLFDPTGCAGQTEEQLNRSHPDSVPDNRPPLPVGEFVKNHIFTGTQEQKDFKAQRAIGIFTGIGRAVSNAWKTIFNDKLSPGYDPSTPTLGEALEQKVKAGYAEGAENYGILGHGGAAGWIYGALGAFNSLNPFYEGPKEVEKAIETRDSGKFEESGQHLFGAITNGAAVVGLGTLGLSSLGDSLGLEPLDLGSMGGPQLATDTGIVVPSAPAATAADATSIPGALIAAGPIGGILALATGEVWNKYFGIDFSKSKYLYRPKPGEKAIVTIKYTGSYSGDRAAANAAAGFKSGAPKGYTWHHLDDWNAATNEGTLQLVETEAHGVNQPHIGGVAYYEHHWGVDYGQ